MRDLREPEAALIPHRANGMRVAHRWRPRTVSQLEPIAALVMLRDFYCERPDICARQMIHHSQLIFQLVRQPIDMQV